MRFLLLALIPQPGKGKPPVTIGTKDFTEEFVLGQLYAQALRAKGHTVNLKSNIGSTEIIDKALTSGRIDAYPEYTGETVTSTFGKNVLTRVDAADESPEPALELPLDVSLLPPHPATSRARAASTGRGCRLTRGRRQRDMCIAAGLTMSVGRRPSRAWLHRAFVAVAHYVVSRSR